MQLVLTKAVTLCMLAAGVFAIGAIPAAWGSAQLDAYINPGSAESNFAVTYQRTVALEYGEDGKLGSLLRGANDRIEVHARDGDPGIEALKEQLDASLLASGSITRIGSLDATSLTVLRGNSSWATISYEIELEGTLQGYTIVAGSGNRPAVVDMAWRDITVRDPAVLNGTEINLPRSALGTMAPDVLAALPHEALVLLDKPLIVSTRIYEEPLVKWHFLFDPIGVIVDASRFGLSEEISRFVVSKFTLGESNRGETWGGGEEKVLFTLDRPYAIRTFESPDIANVHILGFAIISSPDGAEIVSVPPDAPLGESPIYPDDDFPVLIIYGMMGLAAGSSSAAFFTFSNRKLKKEDGMGQQGIDPSLLTASRTSSGGYQTNGAEAQPSGSGNYKRLQGAYDTQEQESEGDGPVREGAMPKGWKH